MSEPMSGTVTITIGDYEKLKADSALLKMFTAKGCVATEPNRESYGGLIKENAELREACDKVVKENSEQKCRLEYLHRQANAIQQVNNRLNADIQEWQRTARKEILTAAYKECESIRQQMTSFQIDADKWRRLSSGTRALLECGSLPTKCKHEVDAEKWRTMVREALAKE